MTRHQNDLSYQTKARFADMFTQSAAVLARPQVHTFELFERRGGVAQAALYVGLAALVSALVGAFFAPFHSDVTVLGQFFGRLLSIPAQFLVFTGLVYALGRFIFRGTGTYPEVAYTFALFFVPLSILGSVLGIFPIVGWLVIGVVWLLMAFYGFIAVQSSMNLRDPVGAGVTLVLSSIFSGWVMSLLF